MAGAESERIFRRKNRNDSMVGARSLLKNTFPNNSTIVGIHPKDRAIRQGITWSRSLDGKKIEK